MAHDSLPDILLARPALYLPVALLLHCSADSFNGKTRRGSSCHSRTLSRSFLRLSMLFTAMSISISGHLFLFMISLTGSSDMCDDTKSASFSMFQLKIYAKIGILSNIYEYICSDIYANSITKHNNRYGKRFQNRCPELAGRKF